MTLANQNRPLRSLLARAARLTMALGFPLALGLFGCGGTADPTPMCSASTTPQAADKFCAPPNIAAGQPLRLQIREQCGDCTHHATRCEVVVTGQDIKLNLLGDVCVLPPETACTALCAINTLDCAVPALTAGTYRVSTPAGSTTVAMMTADTVTSSTACTVPTP